MSFKSFKKLISLIAAAYVVYKVVDLYIWQTPLQLGEDTTYITEPLAEDGLPDYARAIDMKAREGVTPENNGAVLAWQTLGPMDVAKNEFSLICAELGIDPVPTGPFLELPKSKAVESRVAQWLEEQHQGSGQEADPSVSKERYADAAAALIGRLLVQAWVASECPPMAEWVRANEAHLDRLVEAAKRPKFYSPPPNLLANRDDAVISTEFPMVYGSRNIVRSLLLRANLQTGAGNYAEAWRDVLACWRMGEHMGRGLFYGENMAGLLIRQLAAARATVSLLSSHDLPIELAEQIQSDLAGLSERIDVAPVLNFAERLSFLDRAIRVLSDRPIPDGVLPDGFDRAFKAMDRAGEKFKFDPNLILRQGNVVYDELVAAASKNGRTERNAAQAAFDKSIDLRDSNLNERLRRSINYSRSARSKVMADALLILSVPADDAIIAADRDEMSLRMARLAASLAIYRAVHGEYPNSLELLNEAELAERTTDLYSSRPLIYVRRGDGYLLYSVFLNEIDDGGDDVSDPIVDGEWLPFEKLEDFEPPGMDNSDLVIRVPLPPMPSIEALIESHNNNGEE